ncbi:ACP phosphodiesterase, partial [Pseudomonas syringae pv. actinidifoliorum]|nr:ACP phosphodiesterase [Pseudomonas syringae pv. actinidifoliorum]
MTDIFMSQVHTIAVLVGSLRKESINRKIALALAELAPATLKLNIIEIGDLPLYNEDIDGDSPPPAYSAFREQLGAADGVLFVTPEYNRSVPGALKKRHRRGLAPYGKSAFSGKPGAVI